MIYAGAARLGLLMDAVSGFASLVWPATGIALAALLLRGPGLWPGVAIGAFAGNLWSGAPVAAALGIAAGNSAEALLGAWSVRRYAGLRDTPTRLGHVVGLVGLSAIAAPLVSATVGTLSLVAARVVPMARALETGRAWWVGDAIGAIVVAPLLLSWSTDERSLFRPQRRGAVVEAMALAGALGGFALLVFQTDLSAQSPFVQTYLLYPLLIWASLRFGVRGATAATFFVSVVAIWATARGHGPFVHARLAISLLYLQVFMAMAALTTLVLAVTLVERDQAIKSRDWFLAAVSHELKNPLQTMTLLTESLGRRVGNDEAAKKQLGHLRTAGERMGALIRDLLDLAAVEAGQLSIERTTVGARALVQEAVDGAAALAAARSQHILTELRSPEIDVTCDRRRVLQVLVNLIDNAMKFSPEQSAITVRVDADAAHTYFSVADAGPGITPDDARLVFDRFWRARRSPRSGTGLGLAIAKAIVEAHGGRIWLDSRVGVGTTFSFKLPR